MAVEITDVALTYSGKPVSASNKVPCGEKFIITVGVEEIVEDTVVAFIPLNSTGLITSDGKRFCCKKNNQTVDYQSKFTGEEIDGLLQKVKDNNPDTTYTQEGESDG